MTRKEEITELYAVHLEHRKENMSLFIGLLKPREEGNHHAGYSGKISFQFEGKMILTIGNNLEDVEDKSTELVIFTLDHFSCYEKNARMVMNNDVTFGCLN
ncbi:MAG: hypothetical protein ACQESQ_08735 [Bacteroidota bacterium]